LDAGGHDETHYLEILEDRLARGTTPAQELLEKFHHTDRVFSLFRKTRVIHDPRHHRSLLLHGWQLRIPGHVNNHSGACE
jgi:hypothetical protein